MVMRAAHRPKASTVPQCPGTENLNTMYSLQGFQKWAASAAGMYFPYVPGLRTQEEQMVDINDSNIELAFAFAFAFASSELWK